MKNVGWITGHSIEEMVFLFWTFDGELERSSWKQGAFSLMFDLSSFLKIFLRMGKA